MNTQQKDHNKVSVINPKFCVRHSVDLVITKNIWQLGQGNFVAKGPNGNIMFKIEGSILSLERKRVMFDSTGIPIVTLRKKVFTVHSTWQAFRGDGKNEKDLIFSARRSSIFQMKTKLAVFMAKNKSQKVCNYTVQASWFERSCEVYVGDYSTLVAQMHKSYSVSSLVSGKDRFVVTVYPNVDCAFVVALIVILDEIVSNYGRRSSSNKKKR